MLLFWALKWHSHDDDDGSKSSYDVDVNGAKGATEVGDEGGPPADIQLVRSILKMSWMMWWMMRWWQQTMEVS